MNDSLETAPSPSQAVLIEKIDPSTVSLLSEQPELNQAKISYQKNKIEISLHGATVFLITCKTASETLNISTPLTQSILLSTDYHLPDHNELTPLDFMDLADFLPLPIPLQRLSASILRAVKQVRLQQKSEKSDRDLRQVGADRETLLAISATFSEEHETKRLLAKILQKLRGITQADAGSLYLVEPVHASEEAKRFLRFALVQNDSMPINFSQQLLPLDESSLAGYVAATGKPINLERADLPPEDLPVRHAAHFNTQTGYPARSLLTVPMTTPAGKVLGVVQLINRKKDSDQIITIENVEAEVLPFEKGDQELTRSLASQAAVALENAYLHQDIKHLFEGFVKASVTAIEARDPSTSGHSQRVSLLSVELAKKVEKVDTGPYGGLLFTPLELQELEYAALLHDFGKVGVREKVLVKAKKLFPSEEKLLKARFSFAQKSYEAQLLMAHIGRLINGESSDQVMQSLGSEISRIKKELQEILRGVLMANEPVPPEGVASQDISDFIARARGTLFQNEEGEEEPLITADEVISLSIPRGSLTQEERREIESHVSHTFEFLAQIPWTRELSRVPEIAGAHHERMDGRGYPKQRSQDEILPQARILAVVDVFDALTAKDRPYKKAIPLTPALDILVGMSRGGHLDPELVQIFIQSRAYRAVQVNDHYSNTSLLAVKAVKKPAP